MKENKIKKLILDLSNRWDCTPQEAVDRLNSMNESEINKLINSMTKKFKNGGFIDCLRAGGTVPECKCGKKIAVEKAFFGKKLNSYTPEQIKAIQNGTYRHSYIDDQGNQYIVRPWPLAIKEPNVFGLTRQVITPQGKTLYRSQGYEVEKDGTIIPFGGTEGTQWYEDGGHKDAFENSKHFYPTIRETIKSIPPMMQEGGTFSRMNALNMLRSTGSTNRESRQEYRAAKRDARAAGLRGNEMRQTARSSMMERGANRILPALDDGSGLIIEDPIIELNDSFQSLNNERPVFQSMGYQSFNDAFTNARRKGLDRFYWTDPTGKNSGWKSTALDSDNKSFTEGVRDKNEQRVEARDNMVQSAITQAKTAPKWWQRLGNAFMAGTLVNE